MKHLQFKHILLLLCIIQATTTTSAQEPTKFTLSGKVIDKEGCPLIRALVMTLNTDSACEARIVKKDSDRDRMQNYKKAVSTNEDGFFSIESDEAFTHFDVMSLGMETVTDIVAKKDSVYTIVMQEDTLNLMKPVTVRKPVDLAPQQVPMKGVMARKPVIYLYPQQTTEVELLVNFDGKLTFTYPEYNGGWNVTAQPNGKLIDKTDNSEHNYLFWEGEKYPTVKAETLKKGFIVEGKDATVFLKSILPKLGLQPNEYNDFIVYWAPLLTQNKWNFVHFVAGGDYDTISTNTVKPTPDTNIRVFMYYKALDKAITVTPQEFETPKRKGFTLVEWGGAEL